MTDSNAMLPEALRARLGANVVPLRVTVEGVCMREDAEMDRAAFAHALRGGAAVTTSAPSPGDFAVMYQQLVDAGATEIVSVHVGSTYSGTLNAARVGASGIPVHVHLVDSSAASFALGCCVWAASESLAGGGDAPAAIAAAHAAGAATVSVFTVGEVARARAGGRLEVDAPVEGIPVMAIADGEAVVLGAATDVGHAVRLMVEFVDGLPCRPMRIGVGDADHAEGAAAFAEALCGFGHVTEIVRYDVGPSVAAHTGAGTFGAVVWGHGATLHP